jgi:spermidine/putrescine transport system permease protein
MPSTKKVAHPNLLLATLTVFAFLYFPLTVLVLFSFNRSRLMTDWQGFTTIWYQILTRDTHLQDSLANSLWVALWATLLSLAIGVPAGVGLARSLTKVKTVVEVLPLAFRMLF